jgi:hypothetical protein
LTTGWSLFAVREVSVPPGFDLSGGASAASARWTRPETAQVPAVSASRQTASATRRREVSVRAISLLAFVGTSLLAKATGGKAQYTCSLRRRSMRLDAKP